MTSALLDARPGTAGGARPGRRRPDATTTTLAVVALAAVAVLGLWPHGLHATSVGADGLTGAVAYLAMWTAMTLAMMLPTSRPLLVAVARMGRPDRCRVQAAVVTGYLAVWVAAGALAFGATVAGRGLVDALAGSHPGAPAGHPGRPLGAAVLLAAGLFHLSPWAGSCLRRCRSPFGFLARGWRGRAPLGDGLRVGLAYGRSCLGCCAAPMTAMVVVGMHSLACMAAFGLFTARQKTSIWGPQMRVVAGVALVVAAGAWLVV